MITRDTGLPPSVTVTEVENVPRIEASLVADICEPVAPVPTSEGVIAEVVLAVLGREYETEIIDCCQESIHSG